ncbi:MAG: DUF547 domain-containing protein [Gammaproteobacteria bacterium]|nr:DUF547 domain-containing protein [Gammaproteobacteria bacterium]
MIARASTLVLSVILAGTANANPFIPKSDLWEIWDAHDANSTVAVDHAPWQAFLDKYLDSNHESGINRVAYADVSDADRSELQAYLQALTSIDPRELNRDEQLAYWINLYNAATVEVILEHYPVKSIRKIYGGLLGLGPWNREILVIADQDLSLNDVEHRILRPIWQDPRIHYSVNCASIGCPNLLAQAYTADQADSQMTAAARAYVNHPRGAMFDDRDRLQVSSIYDWYQVDFGANEQELLEHLASYAEPELAARLRAYDGRLRYDYDWNLNEP